jgi:hypothetical protein
VQIAPKSGTDWTSGWLVTLVSTGDQFDSKEILGDRVKVTGAPASMTFQGNGRLTVAGVTKITISDTDKRVNARCLVVDPSGMPTLSIGTTTGC